MTAKLIRLPTVKEMTGMATSTIYAMMSRGEFPKPIKLGARAVAWKVEDIASWIDTRQVAA